MCVHTDVSVNRVCVHMARHTFVVVLGWCRVLVALLHIRIFYFLRVGNSYISSIVCHRPVAREASTDVSKKQPLNIHAYLLYYNAS